MRLRCVVLGCRRLIPLSRFFRNGSLCAKHERELAEALRRVVQDELERRRPSSESYDA
jgi:hypothetical protein